MYLIIILKANQIIFTLELDFLSSFSAEDFFFRFEPSINITWGGFPS